MKISGTSTLRADRAAVYRALNDPAVLVSTIPGCQRLEALGGDVFKMSVAAGVGSIKGVYDGEVRLADHEEPSRFTMRATGAGAPGTVAADVLVLLEDGQGGGTVLTYEADAVVGGMIGGVGQRLLSGVSKKTADEFFRNVDAMLSGGATATAAGAPGAAPTSTPSAAEAGQVFTAPASGSPAGQPGFVVGVAVGAAAALLGALVGGWIASRRRG